MILDNLIISGMAGRQQVLISDAVISAIRTQDGITAYERKERIVFEDALALPGLINSHDHLDFNLYPQLANRKYDNYIDWGNDIHASDKEVIDAIARVPLQLRVQWGLYKNLLNGFTTVVNHGRRLRCKDDLVSVLENMRSLHSPGFEKNWKWKLWNPLHRREMIAMHIGEGTDTITKQEIRCVIKSNYLRKNVVAIHAVQLDTNEAGNFAGLVWCPASNYFLLGITAAVKRLSRQVPVVFGTDSTLSAPWNAWHHFRECLYAEAVNEGQLLEMLTQLPAQLWKLDDRGALAVGKRADIVVVKNKTGFAQLGPADILLVVHKGKIRLYDEALAGQLKEWLKQPFSRIRVNNSMKFVQGDLPGLMKKIISIRPTQDFNGIEAA